MPDLIHYTLLALALGYAAFCLGLVPCLLLWDRRQKRRLRNRRSVEASYVKSRQRRQARHALSGREQWNILRQIGGGKWN